MEASSSTLASSIAAPSTSAAIDHNQDPDDCYHMISQLPWEDEVVWDGQEEGPAILRKALGRKCHAAGWIPSSLHRKASDFNPKLTIPHQAALTGSIAAPGAAQMTGRSGHTRGDRNQRHGKTEVEWFSMFPVDNEDLVYGAWEREIIWDPENAPPLISRVLTLDPNDENIVFEIPEDKPSSLHDQAGANGHLGRKSQSHMTQKEKKEHAKKSKIIISRAGVMVEPEMISPPPDELANDKQPWNISNDEYYSYKATPDVALKPSVNNLIQHSTPAVELRQPFFPTFMNRDKLREFHRPPLFPSGKRARSYALANNKLHQVESLTKHIAQQAQLRERQRLESGGGEMFFMHTTEDLSGKDTEIILAECSEEYPPLLNQIGMATKIKNYARRKPGTLLVDQESDLVAKYEHGEPAIVTTSPFLGSLAPGQSLQTLENNMYRAPLYRHRVPQTDFLVIKSQEQYWIREVGDIFTVGQELPIIEVPGPNSKKANNFVRDFLQVYIYRMFWQSPLEPKRIKMDDIKKAFPSHSESSIRKRLKQCADFNRTGDNPNMWYLKKPGEFRLPTEAEIRTIVTPEQCCAYYSMQAAERRLQDAGYGEKSLCTLDDDDDEDKQREMDDEVKAAPWNTTRAFIAAMKQKCLLKLTGVADPTGCDEGFSYVRVPNKPLLPREEQIKEPQSKKTVTGTDADLRRLKLHTAKAMLRNYGIPDDRIEKLPRWDIISLVRDLSTRQARAGEESMSKFARGSKFSIAEHQERYKEECQRIFDLQNKVLASDEVLSTDDEESNDEEDPDIEQGTKTLEFAIENKKSSRALDHEREEAERRDLQRMLFGGEDNNSGDCSKMQVKKEGKLNPSQSSSKLEIDSIDESSNMAPPSNVEKILNIYRTYRDNNGREYVRIETVRKPAVIESYVKIKKNKDAEFIKEFAMSLDESQRGAKRKERKQTIRKKRASKFDAQKSQGLMKGFGSAFSRRESPLETPGTGTPNSSDNLVLDSDRSRRNSISPDNSTLDSSQVTVKRKRKEKDGSKLKCSACGGLGHMKNNRSCPEHPQSIKVAMTREEFEAEEQSSVCAMDIIKTEDTKILINKKFIDKMEETRRNALKICIPIAAIKKRKKQTTQLEELDYLKKPYYKPRDRNLNLRQ